MKRAVSPLIATILLIALTVGIGAMVIGFGRTYVQYKTSCLGYQLTVYDISAPTQDTLKVKVENTGTKVVPLQNDDNLAFVLSLSDGSALTCKLGTTPPANGCVIVQQNDDLEPGETQTITIKLGAGVNANNVVSGHFKYGKCGTISGEAYLV